MNEQKAPLNRWAVETQYAVFRVRTRLLISRLEICELGCVGCISSEWFLSCERMIPDFAENVAFKP